MRLLVCPTKIAHICDAFGLGGARAGEVPSIHVVRMGGEMFLFHDHLWQPRKFIDIGKRGWQMQYKKKRLPIVFE